MGEEMGAPEEVAYHKVKFFSHPHSFVFSTTLNMTLNSEYTITGPRVSALMFLASPQSRFYHFAQAAVQYVAVQFDCSRPKRANDCRFESRSTLVAEEVKTCEV